MVLWWELNRHAGVCTTATITQRRMLFQMQHLMFYIGQNALFLCYSLVGDIVIGSLVSTLRNGIHMKYISIFKSLFPSCPEVTFLRSLCYTYLGTDFVLTQV